MKTIRGHVAGSYVCYMEEHWVECIGCEGIYNRKIKNLYVVDSYGELLKVGVPKELWCFEDFGWYYTRCLVADEDTWCYIWSGDQLLDANTTVEMDWKVWVETQQRSVSILASPVRGYKDVRGEIWVDGKKVKELTPQVLKPKIMVFHAIMEGEDVGFDDYPSTLEDLELGQIPAGAKIVNHFPKMWCHKEWSTCIFVELGGQWWWRVDELEESFWDTMTEKFKAFFPVRKSNVLDGDAMMAYAIKMCGGFQPKVIK